MDRNKTNPPNPELEARLAKLSPAERQAVEAVGRRMAKHRLRKMLDQPAAAKSNAPLVLMPTQNWIASSTSWRKRRGWRVNPYLRRTTESARRQRAVKPADDRPGFAQYASVLRCAATPLLARAS